MLRRIIKLKLTKKLLAMSLVGALAVSTLTACGGSDEPKNDDQNKTDDVKSDDGADVAD